MSATKRKVENVPRIETRLVKRVRRENTLKNTGLEIFAEILCLLSDGDFIKNALLVSKKLYNYPSIQKRLNTIKAGKLMTPIFGRNIAIGKKPYFQAAKIIKDYDPKYWELLTNVSNAKWYDYVPSIGVSEKVQEVIITLSVTPEVSKKRYLLANMKHSLVPYVPGMAPKDLDISQIRNAPVIGKRQQITDSQEKFLETVKNDKCLFVDKNKKVMKKGESIDMKNLAIVYMHATRIQLKWLVSGRWQEFF